MSAPWEWLEPADAADAWPEAANEIGDFLRNYPEVKNPKFAAIFTGTDDHPGNDEIYARGIGRGGIDKIWEIVGQEDEVGWVWAPVTDQEAVKWEADGTKDAARELTKKLLK